MPRKKNTLGRRIFTDILPPSRESFEGRVYQHGHPLMFAEYEEIGEELRVKYEKLLGTAHSMLQECVKAHKEFEEILEEGAVDAFLTGIEDETLEAMVSDSPQDPLESHLGNLPHFHIRKPPLARGKKKRPAE